METINFTASYWKEISDKIKIYKDLQGKMENIDIVSYTSKFEMVLIIFQAYPKDYPARKVETFKKMRRKTKTLELYLVLDYELIIHGTDEENLQHIKEVFLQGCTTFLKEMKGFDWEGFKKGISEMLAISF